MDLSTKYLGLNLRNPLVAAASPLSQNIDMAKRLEDAGAAALVMYSLFEEQINHEKHELDHFLTATRDSDAEAASYFPEPGTYSNLNGEGYLDHIQKLKRALQIPVIASLNGVSAGGWIEYAKFMEAAGADAIELNIYYMATNFDTNSAQIEQMYLDDLKTVKQAVKIPVAMKVGPFFSAFANFAARLDQAGVDGLVLFNRFFGPDIDLETLSVNPQLMLSTGWEMRVPLRWIAVLHGRVKASLAATTGIRSASDVIKMIMAGADVVQLASVLLQQGPHFIRTIIGDMEDWLASHDYNSLAQAKGSLSYLTVAEPAAYERANYMKTLHSYK